MKTINTVRGVINSKECHIGFIKGAVVFSFQVSQVPKEGETEHGMYVHGEVLGNKHSVVAKDLQGAEAGFTEILAKCAATILAEINGVLID